MARPKKSRRICSVPGIRSFEPVSRDITLPEEERNPLLRKLLMNKKSKQVSMTVDEYECIRLMDYQGFSQQECAKRMNVARTTVTMIYDSARKKMAQCLVEGCTLVIDGGNYTVCDRSAECHGVCREKPSRDCEQK